MHKKISIALFYCCFFSGFSSGALCPDGYGEIIVKERGETREKAIRNAEMRISENISSTLEAISTDSLYQKEQGGSIQKDISITTSVGTVKTYLKNKEDIRPVKDPYEEGGEWVSERYMCHSKVVKPYLSLLDSLIAALKNASLQKISNSNYEKAKEIYWSIKKIDEFIIRYGQKSKAKEYESLYAKISNDYGSFTSDRVSKGDDKRRKQRQNISALKMKIGKFESTDNLKDKNEAWLEGSELYKEINALHGELRDLDTAIDIQSTRDMFKKMRENCIAHRKNAKLHWNPGNESQYSEIAFSKLSKNLKTMENSACKNNGISLVYKDKEPERSAIKGIYEYFYKPALSIASCKKEEYMLLKSEKPIEGVSHKKEYALEELQENFKSANFWEEWERELKEWRLQCE